MQKYKIVYQDLLTKIQNNEFKDNKIPAEATLERRYNVSRQTIKTAMEMLNNDGLIFRQKGRGTFIRQKPHETSIDLDKKYLDHSSDKSTYNKNEILLFEIILCDNDIKFKLGLELNEHVYHFKRLRYISDIAETLEETFIPVKLLPSLIKEHLDNSLFEYIKNNTDLKIESTYKDFSLEIPSDIIKEILNTNKHEYCVKSNEYVTLDNATILSYSVIYYSPRKFHFSSITTSKAY